MPNRPKHTIHSPDILELFFEDVAHIPTINGKHDYLPLTRRIQRGGALTKQIQNSPELTFQKILRRQNKVVEEFNRYCDIWKQPPLNVKELASEIEPFFNDTQQITPTALAHSLGKRQKRDDEARDEFEDWGWKCFYILSLFPPELRTLDSNLRYTPEVKSYFRNIHDEAIDAKKKLVEGTLRYVINIARFYISNEIPYIDLVQEGVFGLMTAANKYDERRGHFQSYAAQWIKQRISRYIADHRQLIRVPIHYGEEARQLKQIDDRLIETNGGRSNYWQFFQDAGWLTSDDIEILKSKPNNVSLSSREQEIKQRVAEYFRLIDRSDRSKIRTLSANERRILRHIIETTEKFHESNKQTPTLFETFYELHWVKHSEQNLLTKIVDLYSNEKLESARIAAKQKLVIPKLIKALKKLETFNLASKPIYSIERTKINVPQSNANQQVGIEAFLIDCSESELIYKEDFLQQQVASLLQNLTERVRNIIEQRYGLDNTGERTLEEVGKLNGVTRERIRQIESRALNMLRRRATGFGLQDHTISFETEITYSVESRLRQKMMNALIGSEETYFDDTTQTDSEIEYIESLIAQYIPSSRSRTWRADRQSGRAQIFREILLELGQPSHYGDIHIKAMERIPEGMEFPKSATYTTLFYHRLFRSFGNSTFGLVEWDTQSQDAHGDKIFQYCPMPLLPMKSYPTAFFESIMVGREFLKTKSMTAKEFFTEMTTWAEQSSDPQDAFNAWYSVGLIDWLDWSHMPNSPVNLILPRDAKIVEARRLCIESLCQRVLKMPELLLTIDRIAEPTLANIQKVLFGDTRAGFDVPQRLLMLTALDAVQPNGNTWKLTDLGRKTLTVNQPQELPEFGDIEAFKMDDDESTTEQWQDDLDLMDL